jgi:Ca-activated chloride channel family protein
VPWVLAALPLLLLLAWRYRPRSRSRAAVPFPKTINVLRLPRSRRQRWMRLPATLRILALAILVVALARPQWGARSVRDISRSIGIQMLIDRSGSMTALDMMYNGTRRTRLEIVKRVSEQFIFGNGGDLKGRPSDMIGLISFAVFPSTLCPLTLAHDHLRPILRTMRVADGIENGTAIGDAVALAAARFQATESEAAGQFKSKVIILLTDGENNSGARTVAEAADLARQWGVRIYAIAIRPQGARDEYEQMVEFGIRSLAKQTNGAAFTVRDGSELRAIYARIDELERNEVKVTRLTEGSDGFTLLACSGLGLLLAEALLAQTWLRRIP